MTEEYEFLKLAPPHAEGRAAYRYCCTLKAARAGDELIAFQPAKFTRVLDISTGGIAVHAAESFEVGVTLTIRLRTFTGKRIGPLMEVCVVHASEQSNGTWVLGMAFAEKLSEAELQSLLSSE